MLDRDVNQSVMSNDFKIEINYTNLIPVYCIMYCNHGSITIGVIIIHLKV